MRSFPAVAAVSGASLSIARPQHLPSGGCRVGRSLMADGAGVELATEDMQLAMTVDDDDESPNDLTALPPEFFTPVDEFDAVRHLLENLPDEEGLSSEFLAAQTAQTQTVLDAINSQLSARVMRSYGAFVHGMSQVQQLESDLVLTAILCRSARRHLGRVQNGMVVGGLRLLNRLRRRNVIEQLVTRLRTLRDLGDGVGALEKCLVRGAKPDALPRAAQLVQECGGYTGALEGLNLQKGVVPRIAKVRGWRGARRREGEGGERWRRAGRTGGGRAGGLTGACTSAPILGRRRARSRPACAAWQAHEKLWGIVQKTLQSSCTAFDAEAYDAAVSAAIILSKVGSPTAFHCRPCPPTPFRTFRRLPRPSTAYRCFPLPAPHLRTPTARSGGSITSTHSACLSAVHLCRRRWARWWAA